MPIAYSCLGFGKLFNVLQSPIGQVASQPMRNIETFPSKHMYLSLVEGKVAEFYHNMVKITYFHRFLQTIDGVLICSCCWLILIFHLQVCDVPEGYHSPHSLISLHRLSKLF